MIIFLTTLSHLWPRDFRRVLRSGSEPGFRINRRLHRSQGKRPKLPRATASSGSCLHRARIGSEAYIERVIGSVVAMPRFHMIVFHETSTTTNSYFLFGYYHRSRERIFRWGRTHRSHERFSPPRQCDDRRSATLVGAAPPLRTRAA